MKTNIKVGEVYIVPFTEEDGITPKNGESERKKYFVVLGFDDDGNVYGGVVVNSHVNSKLTKCIRDYHMPIKCSKYSFLQYNSYINCSMIIVANPERLTKCVGCIDDYDFELVKGAVNESPTIVKKMLSRFGLLAK